MMFRFLISFIILNSFFFLTHASILDDTLYNGVGIRPLILGNAYTALAEGPSAIYYNPAGLSIPGVKYAYQNLDNNQTKYNAFYTHQVLLSPLAYSYLFKQDKDLNFVNINAIGYGKYSSHGFHWGLTYKAIRQHIDDVQKDGFGLDFGFLLYLTPRINLGLTGHNFFQKNIGAPPSFSLGYVYKTLDNSLFFTNDFHYYKTNQNHYIDPAFGLEIFLTEGLKVRLGYTKNKPSTGFDLLFPFCTLSYGMIIDSHDNNKASHLLGFDLGQFLEQKKPYTNYSLFKKDTYAVFSIAGNLTEGQSEISLLGGFKIGSNDLLHLIQKASDDRSCKGFIIRVSDLNSSLTSIGLVQEVRQELLKAKRKDKKVYVYIENWATLPEYYLASVADQIMMPELGTISHLGLEIELLKNKRFLDQLGIQSTSISSGIYKDAWSSSTESLNHLKKQQAETVLRSLYRQILSDIQSSREISWDVIYDYFDGRLITAYDAKKIGLVDELAFFEDLDSIIFTEKKDQDLSLISLTDYQELYPKVFLLDYFFRIAVVQIDGSITQGKSSTGFLFGGKSTGSDDISLIIHTLSKDPTIKGVLLRINSPGGSLTASDQIYHAIEKLKATGKTVYASLGNIAASGGYYVAMNADQIFINPGTLTGSIGVVSHYQNFSELFDDLGIDYDVIKTGEYMDFFSNHHKLSKKDISMLQSFQDHYYFSFTDKLKFNRSLTHYETFDVAQGHVFTGKDALQLKLADQIGNYLDAINALAKALDVDPKNTVTISNASSFPLNSGIGLNRSSTWSSLLWQPFSLFLNSFLQ